jgi:GNAT superfamily N-acetyltransferase
MGPTMNEPLTIDFLSQEETLIRQVADWHHHEFGPHNPVANYETTLAQVRERVNSRVVPLCLVAYRGGTPVGTASIIGDDMPTRPEFAPWLADLVVPAALRRQGIGTALFRRAEQEFVRLGFKTGYLFTWDHEPMYTRLGWTTILKETYRNDLVAVMKREF